ncbi:MAG: DUF2281 domain-containing protein [Planctomycetota bacterium]
MSTKEALLKEIEKTPEPVLDAVLEFLRARRPGEGRLTALASEAVLAKDWLRPEEDEAWKDL